jgi:hypothetical protein
VVLDVGPELYVHVDVRFLPAVIGHGGNHAYSRLSKLFKCQALVVDDVRFVMGEGRGNKGMGSVCGRDYGQRVVIYGKGDRALSFIETGVGEVPELAELVILEFPHRYERGENEQFRRNRSVGNRRELSLVFLSFLLED